MDVYSNPDAIYWLWLQRKLGAFSRVVYSVTCLDGGARRIYESTPDELWQLGLFSVKTINALNDRDLEMDRRTLQKCADTGMSVAVPHDGVYPSMLLNLPDPPAALYYKGDLRGISRRPCVAIVGTRNATGYGMKAAEELAGRLTRAGMTVVSGGAKGIDTAAHNGALQTEGGYTAAVLGCGINYRYNIDNEKLRERIAQRGALVSEYPPGTEPKPHHFPIRNRIISGMSLGTVVIEADMGSGSLITARLAAEQGRDVFAMPTGVGTPKSAGIHRLLEDGAYPVRSPLDILKHYYAMYPGVISVSGAERPLMYGDEPQRMERKLPESEEKTPRQKNMETESKPDTGELPDFISEGAARMHQYLRAEPQLADNLARQAQVSAQEAMAQLAELELCGCAQAHPGGRYSL